MTRNEDRHAPSLLTSGIQDYDDLVEGVRSALDDPDAARSAFWELMSVDDVHLRTDALEAVGSLGEQANPLCDVVATALTDGEELVRNAAVEAFGSMGCSASVLLAATADEQSPLVLASLAESLGYLGGPLAAERLRGLANNSDDAIRSYAISSLGVLASTDDDRAFLRGLTAIEHSPRVLPALHIATYRFDRDAADLVLADLSAPGSDPAGPALVSIRELQYLVETDPPSWLRDDASRFKDASRRSIGESGDWLTLERSLSVIERRR